ncbi:MAG: acetyl-CoA carboxylase carboxyltransferase subunit alpha [Candidatus Omnitrophica bacterium]|nr:acetyl-CoA carboxylase carboxyltransferase subunit alpha [Candidatus Omnitrophota bacterium]
MSRLDFEKPILELEHKIFELKGIHSKKRVNIAPEIKKLDEKLAKLRTQIYENLTPWQRIQIARHPDRPYTYDYIRLMAEDFLEVHGDRLFADDYAMVAGFATIDKQKVFIIGHQKGRDVKENVMRNFGCAHPEGYRKAMRLMKMAEKFGLPILILIDTPGAYPGIGAEERGQAQAIATNLMQMVEVATPIVAVVIGEGGSGGALGIGVADRVLILQHAYYSVISPEGCASILWRNSVRAPDAAKALKIMGEDLLEFGMVDEIIEEPLGGAHRSPETISAAVKKAVLRHIKKLSTFSKEEILANRYERFRKIGKFEEEAPVKK